MILDALLSLVPIGAPITPAATGDYASQVIDLLGQGAGTAPSNIIGNPSNSLFGADVGIGGIRPELNVTTGTAFTTGSSGTLNVAIQAAPDTATTYQPGTWTTLAETGALGVTKLTANTVIARFPFPLPAVPANQRPRYLRLLFTVASAAMTAGTIASALVTMVRDDQGNKYAAANFTVA